MTNLAFVFPGQGSQSVGMLSEDAAVVAETFDEASAALGYDLWQLVQSGPAEQLNQTEFTQPALLTASIALWRLSRNKDLPLPEVVAGHSLGEYSALVAAGVIEFSDAVRLVQQRGQFMQTAVPVGVGGMAAILGLEDEQVTAICTEQAGNVQAANFNAPGQVVIAGDNEALNAAIEACKASGAKRAMALTVSAPFHSAMMQPAAQQMSEALHQVTFSAPKIKVIQNVSADYCSNPETIRENLVAQMFSAVQWTNSIRKMASDGITDVVECGPGKVLSGLNKRIDRSISSHNINSVATLDAVQTELSS